VQNANSTTSTKQNTLLQEKNQTAISTKSNIQNNITSVSLCVIIIFRQKIIQIKLRQKIKFFLNSII